MSEQVGMEQDGSMTHNLSLQCGSVWVGVATPMYVLAGVIPFQPPWFMALMRPRAAFPAKWKSHKSALAILLQSVSGGGVIFTL